VFNLISHFVWGEYALNIRDSGWPVSKEFEEDDGKRKPDYQGATVIEPQVGFYEDCITTLDFESLYPSIIRFYNLCPSVLVLDESINSTLEPQFLENHTITHNILSKGKYETFEKQYSFVNHVQGVLPKLLKRLLDARKMVKGLMNICEDPVQKAILNARQNGIKIACNSVYGFCGVSADRGILPCKPVAAVTTLKGRAFIETAKDYVENNYKGSRIIYGDTDSVMIFWGKDVEVSTAAEWGIEAAKSITKLIRSGTVKDIGGAGSLLQKEVVQEVEDGSPVRDLAAACSAVTLAYEKTYRPYLLLKKKNYAGKVYISDGAGGFKTKVDMKGIDAVRRDRPKLLRDTSNQILNSLLEERSVDAAIRALQNSLSQITNKNSPIEDYIISKSIKSNYANPNLPHLKAWRRMIERGDQNVPPIGSRMQYVVTVDKSGCGGKKSLTKLYDRTEHPEFVRNNKLKIDKQYYVETLKNPIVKLLKFLTTEDKINTIFRDASELANNDAMNISSLLSLTNSSEREVVIVKKPTKKRKLPEEPFQRSLRNYFA